MRKLLVGLVAVLSLSLVTSQVSVAAVTPGSKCTKAGATSTSNGKKYTCVKSGKKLIWNKGVALPKPAPVATSTPTPTPTPSPTQTVAPTPIVTPTPTPTIRDWAETRSTDLGYIYEYESGCSIEKDLPPLLSKLQEATLSIQNCAGINRFAKYELGAMRPSSTLTSSATDLNIKQCQISVPNSSMNIKGFFNLFDENRLRYMNAIKIPGPKMTIQVVALYASDTSKPINSPKEDYGTYTDFVADWAKYSSDGESAIEVRYTNNYIEFPNKVSSYNIAHENRATSSDHVRFAKDMISAVDSQINFSGAEMIIVVVPPGTPLASFQQGSLRDLVTNEGTIRIGTTQYPYTLENLKSVKFPSFLIPFWWLHELYHSGIGLDDHYGDTKWNVETDYGLGRWTLMTPDGGDLSGWEKWFIGFLTDSQVHCINPIEPTVRWIAPSSVKTKEKKLIVVPISQTKGIVIESIRPAGLYYKIQKTSAGVLMYEIDLSVDNHGSGMKLLLPTNRNPNLPPFFLSQATFRQGESVVSNGYRITIMESGDFGDVVKVEKI